MDMECLRPCHVSDSGWMEQSMISPANRRRFTRLQDRAHLEALFDSAEALGSLKARGSVLDRLHCVLADSLTVALSGIYANEHSEVLCVQHRRLGFDREMGYTIKPPMLMYSVSF
ncbi:hypothetical protein Tco_0574975 [Tanacetum coccineum]